MSQEVILEVTTPAVNLEVSTGTGVKGATGATGPQGPSGTPATFDHFATVGNVDPNETDLYSDSIAGTQLAANGDKLLVKYAGTTVGHATATRQIKVKFAGTTILDTSTFTNAAAGQWSVDGFIERVSTTVVRYVLTFVRSGGADPVVAVGELTGLDLGVANILKITGQAAAAGAASDDILAILGTIIYVRSA